MLPCFIFSLLLMLRSLNNYFELRWYESIEELDEAILSYIYIYICQIAVILFFKKKKIAVILKHYKGTELFCFPSQTETHPIWYI